MKKKICSLLIVLILFGFPGFTYKDELMHFDRPAYAYEETDEDRIIEITSPGELLSAMEEQGNKLNEEYAFSVSGSLDVTELLNNTNLDYLDSIEWVYNYIVDSDGIEVPQDFNLYEFTVSYRDDFKVMKAYGDNALLHKLTKREAELLNKAVAVTEEVIAEGMNDYEKVLAVHDYLVFNGKYDTRLDKNSLPTSSYRAEGILLNGVGVCASYASAAKLLLDIAGVESVYVTGEVIKKDGSKESHVWNKVKIAGKWYNIDTTWDDPVPDDPGGVSYKYFNVTDDMLAQDHIWSTKEYPQKADSNAYNYYVYNKLVTSDYNQFKSAILEAIRERNGESSIAIRLYVRNYNKNTYDLQLIYDNFSDVSSISYSEPDDGEGEMLIVVKK